MKISRKAVMLIMEKSIARHLENFSEVLNNPLRTLTFCKVERSYLLHFRLASELKRILLSSTTWSFKMKKQTRIWKSRNICFPQIKWIRVGMKGWNLLVLKQCSWTRPNSSLQLSFPPVNIFLMQNLLRKSYFFSSNIFRKSGNLWSFYLISMNNYKSCF